MADAWILQLAQSCDTIAESDSAQLAQLRARFIAVCKSGCDLDHPFGVVETPGDTTEFGDRNLLDVIAGVFPGLDTCTMGCRPELIGFPGTFDVPQYSAPVVQIYYLDTCRCDRLGVMEDCW